MKLSVSRYLSIGFLTGLLAAGMVAGAACGDSNGESDTTGANETTPAVALTGEERDRIMMERTKLVLSSIGGASSEYPDNLMTAEQLLAIIDDADRAGEIFILDTRPRNEWEEQGHIEGATWIQMQEVANEENLARLPEDKLIVCVSPTGHTANQVCTILRWLGYDAVLLKHGMAGWIHTPARDLMLSDVNGGIAKQYPVNFVDHGNDPVAEEPAMDLSQPAEEEYAVLVDAAREVLSDDVLEKEYPFNHIFADVVHGRLQDPAIKDTLVLLDIRPRASRQTAGHIEMGFHYLINWRVLGEPKNLAQLPKDKLIVVIGDTGQTAGQVTPILRMLGYDAVTLRSGLTAWTQTPDTADSLASFQRDLPVVQD